MKKRKRHLSIVPSNLDKEKVRELIRKAPHINIQIKNKPINMRELIDLSCDLTFGVVLLKLQHEQGKRGGMKNVDHAPIVADEAIHVLSLLQDKYKILNLSSEDEECFLGGLMYKYYKELEGLGLIKLGDLI